MASERATSLSFVHDPLENMEEARVELFGLRYLFQHLMVHIWRCA